MLADKITWMGEPSYPYDKRFKRWPQWTLWPFKMKDRGDLTHYMTEHQYNIYLAEKRLIELLPLPGYSALLGLIEAYGDHREEKGRHDVNEEWAERDAGAGL